MNCVNKLQIFCRIGKMIRIKMLKFKYLLLILASFVMYQVFLFSYINSTRLTNNITIDFKYVVVHLDLKGAPPKLNYLETLLPFFKKYGVNGILIEYEDMFPYEGNLVNLSSKYRYDRKELKKFLTQAVTQDIEIIPLVQTFGHMEHVLKLEEYQYLREIKDYPDSICPNKPESIILIRNMLQQVINFHASIAPLKYIHIGCDEVYHMNDCDLCHGKKLKNLEIFTNHVLVIKDVVNGLCPEATVLIWDDMIRKATDTFRSISPYWTMKTIEALHKVQPVYWDYNPYSGSVSHLNLHIYHRSFDNIWISTAFKGADGRRAVLPVYRNRILNHFNWMAMITSFQDVRLPNFEGIIITGWSRYSHMDPLCELLPPSLSSLLLSLLIIKKFQTGVSKRDTYLLPSDFFDQYISEEFVRQTKCDTKIDYMNVNEAIDYCAIDSTYLVILLRQYTIIETSMNAFFINDDWDVSSYEYYSKIKHLNRNNINSSMEWGKRTLKDIISWEENMQGALSNYYEKFVIDEYVGYKIYPMKIKIIKLLKTLYNYKQIPTWERRSKLFPNISTKLISTELEQYEIKPFLRN